MRDRHKGFLGCGKGICEQSLGTGDFYEMVCCIDEDMAGYVRFILTGE